MHSPIIRLATKEDAQGKGYVHYQSWIETYKDMIPDHYLMRHTLERTVQMAYEHPENTWVAIVDERIVGFSCFAKCPDDDLLNSGEIMAIYVLKDYQHQGIGQKLFDAARQSLSSYESIVLWAFEENDRAIKFYEKQGFYKDGKTKVVMERPAIRMMVDVKQKEEDEVKA